jgi:Fe(3+) dicitrate transport protein
VSWQDLAWLHGPFTHAGSRTFVPLLALAVVIGLVVERARGRTWRAALDGWRAPWRSPSARLDARLLLVSQVFEWLGLVPGAALTWSLAVVVVSTLDRWVGAPDPPSWSPAVLSAVYTITLFVAWDASRYAVHRLMHRVGALWAFHQVHHSAEVLTPITFHRVHPVESVIMGARGVLVSGLLAGGFFWWARGAAAEWTLLGVHGIGLLFNAVSGNLRHSHVWWRWGPLERVLLSPAQHQLHHARDPATQQHNYGTWLAVWDQLGGSWAAAPEAPPQLGLAPADRNHDPGRLVDALVGPLRGLRPFAALLALIPGVARAQDVEIVVVEDDGTPRIAGSAHVIDEEALERHAYDDIQRVLAGVPGVYARTEDGFGLRPNIGMRGGSSDRSARILLMEDGIPLAPAPYAAPAAYYFPLVQRMVGVEVIKGAASIRHGPQTIGGAINLRTRPVPHDGVEAAGDVAGGTWGTLRAHTWAGVGGERAGVLAEVAHLSSTGFKELDNGGPTGFQRQDAMITARLGPPVGSVGHTVTLKVSGGRERSRETYLGLSAADFYADPYRRYDASALDTMRWERGQASLAWDARGPEGVRLRTVAYGQTLSRLWDKVNGFASGVDLHALLNDPDPTGTSAVYLAILRGEEDSVTPDQAIVRGANDRRYTNAGLATTATFQQRGAAVRNELELGVRLHGDVVDREHTEASWMMTGGALVRDDSPTVTTLDTHSTALAVAAHAHDVLTIGVADLVPGVRVETIRTTVRDAVTGPTDPNLRAVVLPGFGALIGAADALDLIAGVHRGFSPAAPEADPTASPEVAWNFELGLRARPAETRLEAFGFFSAYQNLVGLCTLSSGCEDDAIGLQYGAGEAWVYGVETSLGQTVHLPRRVDLRGSATWTFTRAVFRDAFASEFPQWGDVAVGDALPYVPTHQGAASLGLDSGPLGVEASLAGRSAMRDVAGQTPIADEELPGIVTLDVSVTGHLGPHVDVYGTATNLLGTVVVESWRPEGAFPSAPRTVLAGVRGRL